MVYPIGTGTPGPVDHARTLASDDREALRVLVTP
jgi:hypothetical protein